jgi:exonuclease III
MAQERASIACLVETKVDVMLPAMATDLMGSSFDYVCLPADGLSGGIMVAWCRDVWSVRRQVARRFSLMISLDNATSSTGQWSLVAVYGPVDHHLKAEFLDELRAARADCAGPMILCGDFNMIYQAADKSNDRLNLGSMRRFRRAIDDMQVDELYLHGRLFTWSNERRRPTMERIDRVFATVSWLELFPNHHLRSLSSDCSDHAPILLQLNSEPWVRPRFRFEAFDLGASARCCSGGMELQHQQR